MNEEQNINQSPKNWNVETFEDMLDYIQPTNYIVESTEYDDSYKTPVLTAGKSFIKGYTNETHGIFNALPVIIFDDFTTANKFVNFPFKVKSSAMKILKPKNKSINILFVFYYMQTVRVSFDTHKRYWISVFAKLPIPSPPIAIQQAIVSKIEELFSELDKGIENLRIAQQQLKTYRQAVLKWAFEIEGPIKIIKLKDVCEFITKGTTPSKEKLFKSGEIPFLKVYNLTFNGAIDFSKDPTYVTHETHSGFLKRSITRPSDVLMNIVGPPLGKVSIVPNNFPEWNINQAIARFRCSNLLFNKYLLYYLLSENTIRTYSRKAKATAGQFNLTLEICRDIEIPLASISEQNKIVQEIESRLSVADKMEESITQSLQQAEGLRQSILKKAFEGKLI